MRRCRLSQRDLGAINKYLGISNLFSDCLNQIFSDDFMEYGIFKMIWVHFRLTRKHYFSVA